jgi:hypothetical protein
MSQSAAASSIDHALPTAASTSSSSVVTSPSGVLQLSYESAAASNSGPSFTPAELAHYDSMLAAQGECGVREFFLKKYETECVKNWDRFYRKNADRFYKDRHYLTSADA